MLVVRYLTKLRKPSLCIQLRGIKVWEIRNHVKQSQHSAQSTRPQEVAFVSKGNNWLIVPTINDVVQTNGPTAEIISREPNMPKYGNVDYVLLAHIFSLFLPAGFPDSVSSRYVHFSVYSFFASISGSAAMVISTQALLLAVGVGSTDAPPMAAVFNWLMKDGIGQLGGVLFASKIGSSSFTFDSHPKRWRLISALALDSATVLETLCPLFPGHFVLIASIANIAKNIGFLTASASRAALNQALTKRDNLGDVTAKAGSQSIAASLIGTVFGISVSQWIGQENINMIAGVLVLSSVHTFFTYLSLRMVSLRSLNDERLGILITLFLKHCDQTLNGTDYHLTLSPDIVAEYEDVWLGYNMYKWLIIGSRLSDLCPLGASQLQSLRDISKCRERYVLSCSVGTSVSSGSRRADVKLTFLQKADCVDVLRGLFHAHALRAIAGGSFPSLINKFCFKSIHASLDDYESFQCDQRRNQSFIEYELAVNSHQLMAFYFDEFLVHLRNNGWNLGSNIMVERVDTLRLRIEDDIAV